jgi:hypothetical protein
VRHRFTTSRRLLVLAPALLVAGLGCAREAPSTSAAAPIDGAPPPPPAALSRFGVPLAYDFSGMVQVIEKAVPKTLGSLDSVRMIGTDARRHYAFEAHRGPFTAFAEGRELHLRATVAYEARGYYKPILGPTLSAGCGSEAEHPRMQLELATPITLTEGWHLASKVRLVRLAPASTGARDRCDVGILHTDVTDRVVEAARSAAIENLPRVDRMVSEIDLRPRFEEWWRLLAQPIRLADGVWLLLGPERLRMGGVTGHERTITVPVALDARPRIVTGAQQPDVPVLPLPPLGRDTIANGFHVLLDGHLDYGTASHALTEAFGAKTLVQAGKHIRVERVAVTPAPRGQLELAVAFSGDAQGTLRFVGTPVYDARRQELTVPDLDYALSVNDRLISSYAWLRDDKLRAAFRERAHFPVASALAAGRTLLLEGLNRRIGDAVTLSAAVDSVAVRGLYVTLDGLVVRAEANGHASVRVKP